MAHGKSLRVIGQSLEAARLAAFELRMDGTEYVVTSDSLSTSGEWILRHALSPNDHPDQGSGQSPVTRSVSFNSAALSRLDDQARKQRRNDSAPNTQAYSRFSQLLRALGDHLDRAEVRAFHISWTPESVWVDSSRRMVRVIPERSPQKNFSNWVRTQDFGDQAEAVWILKSPLL